MTLRGVIQGLLRGSDDPEALLAEEGFGDLPAEMFGQALASYADTAPIAEADVLTPILTELDEGDPADVFAVLEEHPLAARTDVDGIEALGLGLPAVADDLDDIDGFGTPADNDDLTDHESDDLGDPDEPHDGAPDGDALVDSDPTGATDLDRHDDPFADMFEGPAAADEADTFEDLFDHEPEATGDDPSDLDLDF